jgi:four helix bundle protein
MFLQLNHQKLAIFKFSKQLVIECYRLTKTFPPEEKFSLVTQIRRAALSIHLNIAEGSSRKSPLERKRFYEVARGSLVEIDEAFDIADQLGYCKKQSLGVLGNLTIDTFKLLSSLISKTI